MDMDEQMGRQNFFNFPRPSKRFWGSQFGKIDNQRNFLGGRSESSKYGYKDQYLRNYILEEKEKILITNLFLQTKCKLLNCVYSDDLRT